MFGFRGMLLKLILIGVWLVSGCGCWCVVIGWL